MIVQTFTATDAQGKEYTLCVHRKRIDTSSMHGASSALAAMRELRTSDGQIVNYINKGQYEIVGTVIRLHSDAPDAP